MGCTAILSGISGTVAQTLIELDTNLTEINSAGSLESALYQAFKLKGININFNSK